VIERKTKKKLWEGEIEFFLDRATGEEYRRIVGGIAWPYAKKLGFAVVVAEILKKDPATKAHHLRVLVEIEDFDVGILLRRCQELTSQSRVQEWFGDTFNRPMMAYVYHFNKESGQESFSFRTAPHADDLYGLVYFLQMIKECVAPNWKILEFGEHSKLPGYLGLIAREESSKNPAEYPPIAALGYAVVKLRTTSPPEPRRPQPRISPLAM